MLRKDAEIARPRFSATVGKLVILQAAFSSGQPSVRSVEQSNFTLLDKKQLKSTSACGDIWRNYHKGLLYLYIILVVSVFLELAYREIPKNGMAQNRPIPHITVPRCLVKHCVNTHHIAIICKCFPSLRHPSFLQVLEASILFFLSCCLNVATLH